MATGLRKRIFPLHLTFIEKFLLAEDRPKYPMTFVIDLTFSGILDREAFEVALAQAVVRHPLLASFIRPAKRGQLCWVSSNGQLPMVDWAEEGVPIVFEKGEWIDIRNEIGLRIWIRQGADRVQVTTQFQHTCCDGIGAYRFLGDLMAIYGQQTAAENEPSPTMTDVDTARLRGRTDGCRYLEGTKQNSRQAHESLKLLGKIMARGCHPLAPPKPPGRTTDFPGYCSYTFPREEFERLREAAKSIGSMLNDLLLLECFHAMQQWNSTRRRRLFGQTYRILMPVDLRDTRDYETPACNIVGYSFVRRKTSDLRDTRLLASGIREETARIKHDRLGERFVDMISVGARVRGLLPFISSLPRTWATATLTNVGDPSRRFLAKFKRKGGCIVAGNLTLERIGGFPPMRPKTRAGVSIVSYRKELTIGLRCDPHLYTLDDTQTMLDLYVERLRRHLQ